jgi:hypothetical protein
MDDKNKDEAHGSNENRDGKPRQQDSEEENGMATTTVLSTPNTAASNCSWGGRDEDAQDKGWERMRRGREG